MNEEREVGLMWSVVTQHLFMFLSQAIKHEDIFFQAIKHEENFFQAIKHKEICWKIQRGRLWTNSDDYSIDQED